VDAEVFAMRKYNPAFHQHKLLITEQQISDINHLHELADMSQIPLQENAP
jgi:hypothetical protein